MKKGIKIGNVITDEMKAVIKNKDLSSQQVGDILRSILYPDEFEIKDGMARIFAASIVKGYVSITASCAESKRRELERLYNHYLGPKAKSKDSCPGWFPTYYEVNSKFLDKILITLQDIIKNPNNIIKCITNISLMLDEPPITTNNINTNTNTKYNTNIQIENRDTIPPKSPEGLNGASKDSLGPRSVLDDPEKALGLAAESGPDGTSEFAVSFAAEIDKTYRYKVNRGKLLKCLKSVLKKNSAAEIESGYRKWLEIWSRDGFRWAPGKITQWFYDGKFLEEPRERKDDKPAAVTSESVLA